MTARKVTIEIELITATVCYHWLQLGRIALLDWKQNKVASFLT